YGTAYDRRGNPIRRLRPEAMRKAGGDPTNPAAPATTLAYNDGFGIFATDVIDEAGHSIHRNFDPGTGNKTLEQGPNSRCPADCSSGPVAEQYVFSYDGLGRRLTVDAPHDDPAQGYVSVTTQRFEYPNFVSMIERHLLDWTGARWRLSRKLYDGLGRPTAHT